MKRTLIAVGLLLSPALPTFVHAQSVQEMVQSTINAEGKDCPKVTTVKALGTTDTGIPLIAAACSNGDRHVLEILPGSKLDYLSTCNVFESTAKVRCF